MATISMGTGAILRSGHQGQGTFINKSAAANASGTLTSVSLYADTSAGSMTGCVIGIFYVVSGNNLSTRGYQSIGTVTPGSTQTFAVSLAVQAGDYLGLYYDTGGIDVASTGGAGMWFKNSSPYNEIPCTNYAFSSAGGYSVSLSGTGSTVAPSTNSNFLMFME